MVGKWCPDQKQGTIVYKSFTHRRYSTVFYRKVNQMLHSLSAGCRAKSLGGKETYREEVDEKAEVLSKRREVTRPDKVLVEFSLITLWGYFTGGCNATMECQTMLISLAEDMRIRDVLPERWQAFAPGQFIAADDLAIQGECGALSGSAVRW